MDMGSEQREANDFARDMESSMQESPHTSLPEAYMHSGLNESKF